MVVSVLVAIPCALLLCSVHHIASIVMAASMHENTNMTESRDGQHGEIGIQWTSSPQENTCPAKVRARTRFEHARARDGGEAGWARNFVRGGDFLAYICCPDSP